MSRKKLVFSGLLLAIGTVLVFTSLVIASPSKYGASIYATVADRMRIEDGDGRSVVHSSTKDPISGLGQWNKL